MNSDTNGSAKKNTLMKPWTCSLWFLWPAILIYIPWQRRSKWRMASSAFFVFELVFCGPDYETWRRQYKFAEGNNNTAHILIPRGECALWWCDLPPQTWLENQNLSSPLPLCFAGFRCYHNLWSEGMSRSLSSGISNGHQSPGGSSFSRKHRALHCASFYYYRVW